MKEKKGASYYSTDDGPKGTLHAHKEDYGEQMSGAVAPQVSRLLRASDSLQFGDSLQLFKFSVADGRSLRPPPSPPSFL